MIDLPCAERGPLVRPDVFRCPIHGECSLTPIRPRLMPCSACRDRVADGHRAETFAQPNGDCIHRGELIESIGCGTCAGQTRIKVFACVVHQRCQLGCKLAGVASCDGCRSRPPQPKTRQET